jgi:pyruvate,water dikinase
MPWQALDRFDAPAISKLHNLRRARRAGLHVPETVWAWAAELEQAPAGSLRLAGPLPEVPCIVRSASPTEDTAATSNAGQLLSLVVEDPGAFAEAVARVVAALPRSDGRRQGAVFVQPLVRAEVAGVSFFDGFYFEETWAVETNQALTAGHERGHVRRGHVQRGDPHHAWLLRLQRLFGGRIDIEWARPYAWEAPEPVLLQVRPALFPIRRCQTLSLANHKEILGDPPSPWMVGVVTEVGRPVMRFFEAIDPPTAAWEEAYAIELAGRAWLNFSAFFRLMDRWGLPRTMVTDGVGGDAEGPADGRWIPRRLVASIPTLARLGWACATTLATIGRGLRTLEAELDRATSLLEIQRVNVRALEFSVRTNFAIMSLLSALTRVRKWLGLEQAARVVTQAMMAEYARLAAEPELAERLRALDRWLARYGHRGPLESDPSRPRFAELRAVLQADLARGPAPPPPVRPQPSVLLAALARPLFLLDEVRERFRDRLMRWWQTLRARILAEARHAVEGGWLDRPDDVFFLRAEDLGAAPEAWRERVHARRAEHELSRALALPATAPRDVIEAVVAAAEEAREPDLPDRFSGIGLGQAHVLGTAVRADELTAILAGQDLPETPVLVVDTLEPSWAVVFPRFSAVIAELGGELSHASILLREAGIPAVVNARGAYQAIADGDLVRVDPVRGEIRIEVRRTVMT